LEGNDEHVFHYLGVGIPASLLLSAILLVMMLTNPRLLLRGYRKDVPAAVPPLTSEEKRTRLFWAIPFWLMLVGFPTGAAWQAHTSGQGFFAIFLSAFGVIFLFNLVDLLILDWLIVCTIMPKFVVVSGTEGIEYKNYAVHLRGFLIGTMLSVVVGLVVATFVTFL
jgi:hypothetical protein